MKRTLIYNAQIVNEGQVFKGSVVIEDEYITEILVGDKKPINPCDEIIDAQMHYLLPGIIDDHVHFREPGLTHKADIASESRAAVAGGVTSFMDMPNVLPQTTTLEALEDKFRIGSQHSMVNYSFYFGATNNNTHLLKELDPKQVCGIKLFMGASTGNMLVDRKEALKQIFSEAPMLIAAHCEDQNIIRQNTEKIKEQEGDDPSIDWHPIIRSEEACYASSSLAVQLAKETGARLHLLHITTARELGLLEKKPLLDKQITAEVCIAHLLFSKADYKTLGTRIKCNPSIKDISDRDALRQAINSELIDIIGTDHAPHLLNEKNGGALKAVSGMPMIQFSLVCMMELVRENIISIENLVQKMCHNPASLYQIAQRGYIRKGYKADLVLLNPDHRWTLTPEKIQSKCGWSPLEGKTFHSQVEKTFINGHLVYNNGIVNENNRGQALQFNR